MAVTPNGTARRQLDGLPCAVSILGPQAQDLAKLQHIRRIGADNQSVRVELGIGHHA